MCIVGKVKTATGVRSVEDLGASGKVLFLNLGGGYECLPYAFVWFLLSLSYNKKADSAVE